MNNHINKRLENDSIDSVNEITPAPRLNTHSESSYSDKFTQLGNSSKKISSNILSRLKNANTTLDSQKNSSDVKSTDASSKLEKRHKRIAFSGTTDANPDYGSGGGHQYFIQHAKALKRVKELTPMSQEILTFNPKTDIYTPDIRKSKDSSFTIHIDDRPLSKEELEQLDSSTPDILSSELPISTSETYDDKTISQLDENTASTQSLTKAMPNRKHADYHHPMSDQEDSNGFNHPDGWSDAFELKDGDTYYQLIPVFKDGAKTNSSYFTDKETIDSCRGEDGTIILSKLMQKLQKSPNLEEVPDPDGTTHKEYVSEYAVIQYRFNEKH